MGRGGGNIEDQSFYDLADEFGIMLQQDFPAAGCGYTTLNATGGSTGSLSWDWISHPAVPDEPSLVEGYALQLPLINQQLISHPSVVRYDRHMAPRLMVLGTSDCTYMRVDWDALQIHAWQ
eukprot:COSAG02_NODE_4347_length_5471_cov_2.563477_7_plen_121_part_00